MLRLGSTRAVIAQQRCQRLDAAAGRRCWSHILTKSTSTTISSSDRRQVYGSSNNNPAAELPVVVSLHPRSIIPIATNMNNMKILHPFTSTMIQKDHRRYKHSGRMGHKLDTLEELAHRPEREAAQERRQKKKERKAAKQQKGSSNTKKNSGGDEPQTAATTLSEFDDDDNDDDDIYFDDDDDESNDEDDDEEPTLPDPNLVKERMRNVIGRFQESLKTIRGADPSPEMFDDVQVSAYGSMTPLKAVGQVVIASPTLAQITCFDPALAKDVQKAIQLTLELNPQLEEGGMLRVPLPRVSMEVREQTAKQLQKKAESCKQRIRTVRRKAMDVVKKGKDGKLAGISKDDAFASGKEIEAVTESVMDELKKVVDDKMDSIMAV